MTTKQNNTNTVNSFQESLKHLLHASHKLVKTKVRMEIDPIKTSQTLVESHFFPRGRHNNPSALQTIS